MDQRWMQRRPLIPHGSYSYQDSGYRQQNQLQNQPTPDPTPSFSHAPRNSVTQEQQTRQGWQTLRCFKCQGTGHFARNCPDRGQRVNRVQQGRDDFLMDAKVDGVPAKALIDSGADVTVVPAHLVSLSAYTGEQQWTGGLGWSGSLLRAKLTLSLQGNETDMTVVVKEGIPEVLVGRDFPGIFDLLIHSSTIAKQKEVGKQVMVREEKVAPVQTMVGEGPKSLAAEAEDVEVLRDTKAVEVTGGAAEIQAVKTRAQRKRDEQLCREDDEASAQSGAIPLNLCSLDDTLFATSKIKATLTEADRIKEVAGSRGQGSGGERAKAC